MSAPRTPPGPVAPGASGPVATRPLPAAPAAPPAPAALVPAGLPGVAATATGWTAAPSRATATPALAGLQVIVVGPEHGAADAGAGAYTAAVARHLATAAAGVTVLTGLPRRPDGRVPEPYRRGLRTVEPGWFHEGEPLVVRLRRYAPAQGRPLGAARQALHELTFLANAAAAGRGRAADLVVGVTPGPAGAAAAAWLARRCGAPLVTIVQAPVAGAGRVAPALERYALRRSAQVAVASEAFRDRLLDLGLDAGRLHLLPAWSRVPAAGTSRAAARRELGWEPGRFVAVHAAPLGHQQDGATVVEAARLLAGLAEDGGRPGGADGEVLFVGDGPQRAALQQQAFGVPGVRFLDPVDDETLPLVLAAADVLLLGESSAAGTATGTATASGQLATYLGAGRAVVAAVPAGSPTAGELRRTCGAGVRVAPGDAFALCRALLDLQGDGPRRAAMGRSAARYARAHLGREACLRRLDAIVEAALAGGLPGGLVDGLRGGLPGGLPGAAGGGC